MNMDQVDVLSFLFMLGSLELGQDYSKTNLSPTQTQMLDDLTDFGLIYQTSSSSKRFYPTRLATTLTSDSSALASTASFSSNAQRANPSPSTPDQQGFILIETNYRIYAYTNSPLQIAILQLFCRIAVRYPNMVAGKITRDSIRRAVSMGITSDQIISFLATHAHPQMRKNNPVLPPTVVDQIKLWQIENERMKATPGFLLNDFTTFAEYESACNYAREIGVLAWNSDEKRMFFVTRVEQVAAYLKRGKPGKAG
jgi:transcription initiation factor TFIIH subunit 4